MPNDAATLAAPKAADASAGARRRSKFFVGMAVLLLLTVFLGFSPTFFLRAFFNARPIPLYLYFHGALLTGWFVWLVVQTSLVQRGRTDLHRKLGAFGAAYAVVVVLAGLMASRGLVPNIIADGIELDARLPFAVLDVDGTPFDGAAIEFVSTVVWLNIASVLTFGSFILAAVIWRRRPDTHKRLMLLASFSIVGPATARITQWPIFGGTEDLRVALGGMLFIVFALAIHDFARLRRPHPATYLGGAVMILMVFAGRAAATSDFGLAFVRGLA